MRRLTACLLALGLLPFLGALPARADSVSGGTVIEQCRSTVAALPAPSDPPVTPPSAGPLPPSQPVSQTGPRGCRTGESVVWGTAATCRTPVRSAGTSTDDPCTPVDGRAISDGRIAAYEQSWVHQALGLQQSLTATAPLWAEQIPHTHNSFNSSAYRVPTDGQAPSYYPTLTNQDPNQVYSLADQLNMDVRFLELDLHWWPSPYGDASTGGRWVTLCHGDSGNPAQFHVGCTDDRPLQDGLAEIRGWMQAHPDQFVFIYFEDQLNGDPQAHEIAAQLISQAFDQGPAAPTIYKPFHPCDDMPLGTSQAAMQATGAHLLIVGNCDAASGMGTAWGTLVHSRGPGWDEGGDPSTYGADQCRSDTAEHHPGAFRRYFGDDTWLTAMVSRDQNITADNVAAMTACGVNIIGMDQLTPDDGRLAAEVWSWAPSQPAVGSGDCALQEGSTGADPGRFTSAPCAGNGAPIAAFACQRPDGSWAVTRRAGSWVSGPEACATELPGSTFAVPVNGLSHQQLVDAAHGQPVWLDYARVQGSWTPGAAGAGRPPMAATATTRSAHVASARTGGTGDADAAFGPTTRLIARHAPTGRRSLALLAVALLGMAAVMVARRLRPRACVG